MADEHDLAGMHRALAERLPRALAGLPLECQVVELTSAVADLLVTVGLLSQELLRGTGCCACKPGDGGGHVH